MGTRFGHVTWSSFNQQLGFHAALLKAEGHAHNGRDTPILLEKMIQI